VKWTYREFVVTITAALGSPASFRPIIEIDSNSRDPPTALTTGLTTINQRESSSVKWTYRECVVTITAAFRLPGSFRPIIKIDCNFRDPPTALTTDHTFLTTEQALEFGQDMAHEWIDGHFR
jgi:hypothetical protein